MISCKIPRTMNKDISQNERYYDQNDEENHRDTIVCEEEAIRDRAGAAG